jgi:hypothetical protein
VNAAMAASMTVQRTAGNGVVRRSRSLLTVEAAAAMWLLIRWARAADPSPAPTDLSPAPTDLSPAPTDPEPAGGVRWRVEVVRAQLGLAGVLAGAEMLVS